MTAVERALAILGLVLGLVEMVLFAMCRMLHWASTEATDDDHRERLLMESAGALGIAMLLAIGALLAFMSAHLSPWLVLGLPFVVFPLGAYAGIWAVKSLSSRKIDR